MKGGYRPGAGGKRKPLPQAEITQLYLSPSKGGQGLSAFSIALRYDVCEATILHRLTEWGVKKRRPGRNWNGRSRGPQPAREA